MKSIDDGLGFLLGLKDEEKFDIGKKFVGLDNLLNKNGYSVGPSAKSKKTLSYRYKKNELNNFFKPKEHSCDPDGQSVSIVHVTDEG